MYDKNLSVEEIIKQELAKYDLALGDLTDAQIARFKEEIKIWQSGGTVLDGMSAELVYIRYNKLAKEIAESRK